ncbi:hypothetical protein ECD92_00190, partial [Acinetobacter baumannii]|nr:hypothetical protein [Acinetobacter baumannii]
PLLTLCDALLRMFAGLFADPVDILAIPEVLIGGVNVTLTTLLTPACADAQVFFCPLSALLQIAKIVIPRCT